MELLHIFSALLLFFLNVSDAKVEFTSSTMYNIFDFEGKKEIPLPRCDSGCLIFASTDGNFKGSDDGIDPYNKNLLVYDQTKDRNKRCEIDLDIDTVTPPCIAEIALQYEEGTSKKVPFDIWPSGPYVILNLNAPGDKGNDVTVVEKNYGTKLGIVLVTASEFDYEIYDAANLNRAPSWPSTIITVMSALPFRVIADAGEPNSYTARLVGFDNALDNNPDKCNYEYKTDKNSAFEGFTIQVNAPIISIVFNVRKSVNLKADFNYANARDLAKSGFISSPGYNGCAKLGNNQVHLAKQYRYSEQYEFHGEPDNFNVVYDSDISFTDDHKITIKDMTNNQRFLLTGVQNNNNITLTSTQLHFYAIHLDHVEKTLVTIAYDDLAPPQSFMLRFTSTQLKKETTPVQTTSPKFVSPTTTTPITSTTVTPTTSSAAGVLGMIVLALVYSMIQLLN